MAIPRQKNNKQFKHLAFQIAAQLPEEPADALRVLELARRLVTIPLEDPEPATALRLVDRD